MPVAVSRRRGGTAFSAAERAWLRQRLRQPVGLNWAPGGHGHALPHFSQRAALGPDRGSVALLHLQAPCLLPGAPPDPGRCACAGFSFRPIRGCIGNCSDAEPGGEPTGVARDGRARRFRRGHLPGSGSGGHCRTAGGAPAPRAMTGTLLMDVLARLVLWVVLAPLAPGVVNRVKAWMAGRRGPPVLQLYYDLARLWRKGVVLNGLVSPGFVAGPVVAWVAVLGAAALWPHPGTHPWFLPATAVVHAGLRLALLFQPPARPLHPWFGWDPLARALLPAVSLLFLGCAV